MSNEKKRQDEQAVCPHCGYCPHCGRAREVERVVYVPVPYPVAPYQPYYISPPTYTPQYPHWQLPTVICGSGNLNVSDYPPGESSWTVQ